MKKFYLKIRLILAVLFFPVLLYSQSNQYLHFDKIDDYVQLPNGSQYIAGASGFSMTGWFYCDALAYGQGYMGFRSGTQGFYLIQLNNGVMECRMENSAGTLFNYDAPANSVVPQMWQHIAWIYDGSTLKYYTNGVLKGSIAASGSFTATNIAFAIGKSLLGTYNFVYGGRVDEVSVWNKALTQAEIQDIMANELTGTEANLQLYYKFDQGVPGGNNTSITKLINVIGGGTRDADLMNFQMVGDTSNFGGTLNPGFQAISFPQVPNKLTTDGPFNISATASSGLAVVFDIVSGPATINGNQITLTGATGDVLVRANQPGGGSYTAAAPVINTFSVYDPATHTPDIDVRSPLNDSVFAPTLKKIQLAALSTITVPELFSVQELHFIIDGVTIPAQDFHNGHYTAWWLPTSYGAFTMSVVSSNNFGHSSTQTVTFTVVPDTINQQVIAAQNVLLNTDVNSVTVDAQLPVFVGAFNKITATLQVTCPTGGCGAWDRIASVDARGHDGQWFQIIKYITPYGVACSHTLDVTDYMCLLSGKVSFRLNCATLDNGYLYKLTINYTGGVPPHCYSNANLIWQYYYPFGDYANLQPVPVFNFSFPGNAVASKLKLVSTGHGWGDLNTSNAAEFYDATHHIWVNNVETFTQHNWQLCNPNPDGCQPQNGTWYNNRAGWCPGSIAKPFDFDMTPFISASPVQLKYVFFPTYIDLCHPNNPNCVTGVTCTDCSDGFNPALDVACNLIVWADNPILTGIDKTPKPAADFNVYPVPSTGLVNVSTQVPNLFRSATITILTPDGKLVKETGWNGENTSIDLSSQPRGMYFLRIQSQGEVGIKKILLF